MSAERQLGEANGGEVARRYGGQREEENQPIVWPQRPGEVPVRFQVRIPVCEALGAWETALPPGGCASMRSHSAALPRRGCWLLGAAATRLARLCRVERVVKSHVLCLGVSDPRGP